MKPSRLRLLLPVFAFVLATTRHAAAQGPITPPSGPAVPIMKSLGQVEPRTPIPGGSAGYTISAPGSYYLTGSITTTGPTTGIKITAANVTLDLCGFTVAADPAAGFPCIEAHTALNLTVRNGILSGGRYGLFVSAVSEAYGFTADSLTISGSAEAGICTTSGIADLTISNCFVTHIGGAAAATNISGITIYSGGVVKNCVIQAITGSGTGNCDGILTSASCFVENCMVGSVTTSGTGICCGINLSSNGIAANNRILGCKYGVRYGKYQNNVTSNCPNPFSLGVDAGGND